MKPRGTIVIDEMVVPVDEVHVADGAFVVQGTMELRRDLPSGDYDYRLHSDDGQLVFKNRQYIDLKNAVRGDTVVLTVRCEVTGKVALELP